MDIFTFKIFYTVALTTTIYDKHIKNRHAIINMAIKNMEIYYGGIFNEVQGEEVVY